MSQPQKEPRLQNSGDRSQLALPNPGLTQSRDSAVQNKISVVRAIQPPVPLPRRGVQTEVPQAAPAGLEAERQDLHPESGSDWELYQVDDGNVSAIKGVAIDACAGAAATSSCCSERFPVSS